MSRLIDADKLTDVIESIDWYHLHNGRMVHGANSYDHQPYYMSDDIYEAIRNAPTVEAIPIEWIKKHIENDRQSAEKAKNDKLLRYFKTLEICAECLLYDWEDENGKYKEFDGEIWQD